MDGNGRWAENRRLPRIVGHQRGVEVVQKIVTDCRESGIPFLTLYAFSSENWGRPAAEVNALMGLLGRYLQSELDSLLKQGIQLRVIGEINRLPAEIRQILESTIESTASNREMVLTLALSYGSRNEILRAMQAVARDVAAGRLDPARIDEEEFAGRLDTAGLPDPDLLIRTSGEHRISNFLLWQLAYTELYFSEALWPDFSPVELHKAIDEFSRRQRRFGLTGAQLARDRDSSSEDCY
ncbi:isoprenyl transferase [Desulfuromonas carbonis]